MGPEVVLEQILKERVSEIWPEREVVFEVAPSLDRQFGDYVSDCAIQLARILKEPPEALAAKVVEQLPIGSDFEVSVERGFLNFSVKNFSAVPLQGRWQVPSELDSRTVLVGQVVDPLQFSAGLRSLAEATVYATLLASSNRLKHFGVVSEDSERVLLSDPQDLINVAKLVFESLEGEAIESYSSEGVALFLVPESAAASFWQKDSRRGSFQAPVHPRGWYFGWDEQVDYERFQKLSMHQISSLFLYLARGVLAQDLEWLVPQLEERDNLAWYLSTLLARIDTLCGSDGSLVDSGREASDACLGIRVQAYNLSLFWRKALSTGDIGSYIEALSLLARAGATFCNDPELNIRSSSGRLTNYERESLIALKSAVQNAMDAWTLLSRACLRFL